MKNMTNSVMSDNPNHPTMDQLVEYSAGVMPMSRAMCIAAHLEQCSHCRQIVNGLNAIGSEQLEAVEPVSVSDTLKNQVLARILEGNTEQSEKPAEKPAFELPGFIPKCVRQFVTQGYEQLPWRSLSPSVRLFELCTDTNGAKAALVRIKPGGRMAHHTHTGEEVTVVLDGAFSDEDGMYQSGDYVFRDGAHKHKPVATLDGECVCLIVLDGPIQFTGFFTRLINPFLRRNHPMPV